MQAKFDKYFEDTDRTNMLFEFAVILDPRYKLEIIQFGHNKVEDVKFEMQLVYRDYEGSCGTTSKNQTRTENIVEQSRSSQNSWMAKFESFRSGGTQSFSQATELERYLADGVEAINEVDFDILQWWKVNSGRYPILSRMAEDILAIPVSTVASESAFSTGGRVVDSYKSSLSPNIVEALICTQDWIRKGRKQINEVDDSEKYDDFAKDLFDKIESMGMVED